MFDAGRGFVGNRYAVGAAIPFENRCALLRAEFLDKCVENSSHIFALPKLSGVETDANSATEAAVASVIGAVERPVEKAIRQFDVADDTEQAANADQRVDFLTFEDASNLDFVVGIDFLAGVVERFHFLVVFDRFRVTARSALFLVSYAKVQTFF